MRVKNELLDLYEKDLIRVASDISEGKINEDLNDVKNRWLDIFWKDLKTQGMRAGAKEVARTFVNERLESTLNYIQKSRKAFMSISKRIELKDFIKTNFKHILKKEDKIYSNIISDDIDIEALRSHFKS